MRGASRLDAFSVYPFQTWLLCHAVGRQQIHQWSVHHGPLVLKTAPLKYPPPAPDRDRTVSRRSEPSSRTALTGLSLPRVHIDGVVWHIDVGSSHPGAVAGPKGWAVRPLKRYASWVQNVVRQFGPYPARA